MYTQFVTDYHFDAIIWYMERVTGYHFMWNDLYIVTGYHLKTIIKW